MTLRWILVTNPLTQVPETVYLVAFAAISCRIVQLPSTHPASAGAATFGANQAALNGARCPILWAILASAAAAAVAVVCVSVLTVTSTVATTVRLAADALMMTGTGTQTPSQAFMKALISDYIDPATGGSYTGQAVSTPETLPLNTSMDSGLSDLAAAMAAEQTAHPGQPFLIEGYSQSALIAIEEKRQLQAARAAGQPVPDVTFAVFGNGYRPNGGLFARFPGLYIPVLGLDFRGAEPTDSTNGIPTIDISRQYDFFSDWPTYPINPVADLNAVLGLIYVHSTYDNATTPLTGPYATQYVEGSRQIVKQQQGDTTFYLIPTQGLPLFGPLRQLGVPESVIDIIQPLARVIVEAGYDRSTPLGQPTPAQLIPTIDPLTFSVEVATALVTGANNAFSVLGAQLPGADTLTNALLQAKSVTTALGSPYTQAVSALDKAANPIAVASTAEGPLGKAVDNTLELIGAQPLIKSILGLALAATPLTTATSTSQSASTTAPDVLVPTSAGATTGLRFATAAPPLKTGPVTAPVSPAPSPEAAPSIHPDVLGGAAPLPTSDASTGLTPNTDGRTHRADPREVSPHNKPTAEPTSAAGTGPPAAASPNTRHHMTPPDHQATQEDPGPQDTGISTRSHSPTPPQSAHGSGTPQEATSSAPSMN
jgi:hypothetical protein